VDGAKLVDRGQAPGLMPAQERGHGPFGEQRTHVRQPPGVLRVARLAGERQTGRDLEEAAARVVLEHSRIVEDVHWGGGSVLIVVAAPCRR